MNLKPVDFKITGLCPEPFVPLYGLSDAALAGKGVRRYFADVSPGFPDRIEMRDARVGEPLLLINFEHQPANSPYRSRHAIFVIEGATKSYSSINEVPDVLTRRQISLRGFDEQGMMVDADIETGDGLAPLIRWFLANEKIAYVHAHNAKQGCYAGLIERA